MATSGGTVQYLKRELIASYRTNNEIGQKVNKQKLVNSLMRVKKQKI